jgi:hypothetical protein
MPSLSKPKGRGACPSFYFACCREASRGGDKGYRLPGYALAGALHDLAPYDVEEEEWGHKLSELSEAIWRVNDAGFVAPPDDEAVLTWLDRWLPRCMALVPSKRRRSFLEGLYQFTIEEGNAIDL